jgi:hypothetical protein
MPLVYVGVKSLYPPAKVKASVKAAIKRGADQTEKFWNQHGQEYSGNIRVEKQFKGDGEATVGTSDERVGYVDYGTRPHVITGSPLAFPQSYSAKTTIRTIPSRPGGGSGDTVFAFAVNHPGVLPRRISETIAKAEQPQLEKVFADEMKKLAESAS